MASVSSRPSPNSSSPYDFESAPETDETWQYIDYTASSSGPSSIGFLSDPASGSLGSFAMIGNVHGNSPSPYISGNTPSSYVAGSTPSPYMAGNTPSPYVSGNTSSPFVPVNTPSPYVSGNDPPLQQPLPSSSGRWTRPPSSPATHRSPRSPRMATRTCLRQQPQQQMEASAQRRAS
ncbi:hypothetical protein NW754_006088 [Fusarium falciforme]|nr:hypothetical protein NW754_006088 [Fusarium falciforme]